MGKKLLALIFAAAGLLSCENGNISYNYAPIPAEIERNEKNTLAKFLGNIEEKDWEKDEIWKIISSYYKIINTIPEKYAKTKIPKHVSKKYVRSLIRVESTDVPTAKSHCGAGGLGQIMKGTWYGFTNENYEKNVFIPEKNIPVTIKCLVWADKFCSENHPYWGKLSDIEKRNMISACYNMGPYGAKKVNWNVSKMPKETQLYIPKINKTMRELFF